MDDAFVRLRAIVEGALDRPEAERVAWLAEACGDDAGLRAEAEALIEASLTDDTFFDTAPPLAREGGDTALAPGTRIGSYELLRTIGRGGMGTVFEAQQETPRRRVALKVMQASLLGRGAAARFRYEIEVLGTLRHPGIAQIYDAGVHAVEGGLGELPWFAMERIEQPRTLIEHARENALDTRTRIGLFLQVCDAVQHGHQKGIIHRDLKPDNLLVGTGGNPKVIDFGVARVADREALEATLRTQADEIVGTLAYMSPEQVAGGDVDTRSDVYALGVVLYQLLTEALPIEVARSDFLTSARRIIDDPPRRPRTFVPDLRKDLEAILLKCLDKEPTRRYASAGALATDLRRHLAGEAVEARPPSAVHQLKLFARRNKVFVGASVAVFVIAVAASIVSLQFAFASKRAEGRARTKAEEARRAEKRAASEAAEAEAQRDRFQRLFEHQFAQSVETISASAPDLIEVPGGAAIAERMLGETIERLKELEQLSPDDTKVIEGIVYAYLRLGMAQGSTGNPGIDAQGMGISAIREGLGLVERLIERHPDEPRYLALRARILAFIAQSLTYTEGLDSARAYVDRARVQLDALPAGFDAPMAEAYVSEVEASVLLNAGDNERALVLARRARALLEEDVALRPPAVRARLRLNLAWRLEANAQLRMRRFGEAERSFQAAARVAEGLARDFPERVMYRCVQLASMLGEATAVKAQGRAALDRLAPIYERAKALDEVQRRMAPMHLSVRINHIDVLAGLASLRTTEAMRDHAKGSPGRIAGLRAALALHEEGARLYEELEREGRLRRADRLKWERLKRMIAFYRGTLGPADASDPHHVLEPPKGAGDGQGKPGAGEDEDG